MAKVKIDKNRCKGCLLCVGFCPRGCIEIDSALNIKGVKPVKFKESGECAGCLICAIMCPDCCIEIEP